MTPASVAFLLESPARGRAALDQLGESLRLHRDDRERRKVTWFDTFDGRLRRADLTLGGVPNGRAVELELASPSGESLSRSRAREVGFAWDLPAGRVRDELAPVAKMRRLLPLVTVDEELTRARVLDAEDKTLVRLALIEGRAGGRSCGTVLRVDPLRGYDREHLAVVAALERITACKPEPLDLAALACAGVGIVPGRDPSRFDVVLDPSARADAAAHTVLKHLLGTIRANEEGLLADTDTEFLHDLRVAVRRTRSVLGELKDVFPAREHRRFAEGFAWLGRQTGPSRDLDVFQLKLRGGESAEPGHAEILALVERRRRRERSAMVRSLRSKRYAKLLADWEAFLDSGRTGDGEAAGQTIREVVEARVRAAHRKLVKRGRALGPDAPAAKLHRVRIQGKKLRYLLDLFGSVFPAGPRKELVRELKRLQDVLGDMNDMQVQESMLASLAVDAPAEPAAVFALGRMAERTRERAERARRRFPKRFLRFDGKKNRAHFAELFGAER